MSLARHLMVWTTCLLTLVTVPVWAQPKATPSKAAAPKLASEKPAKPASPRAAPATPSAAEAAPSIRLRRLASEATLFFLASNGWSKPLATTTNHTEQLLAKPSVQEFALQLFAQFKQTFETNAQRDPGTALALDTVPTLIKAAFQHPCMLLLEDVTFTEPQEFRFAFVIDAESDANPVRAAFTKLIGAVPKEGPGSFAQESIDGATFYQPQTPRGHDPRLPQFGMFKSYLILTVGSGMAKDTVKKIQGADRSPAWLDSMLSELSVDRPKLVWRVNVDAIKKKVEPLLRDPEAKAFLEASGLFDLTQISSVVGLDDVDCISKIRVETSGAPRGLLNLIAGKPLSAEDLKAIPANPTQAHLIRFDLEHVMEELLSIAEQSSADARGSFEELSEQARQGLGFSVIEDLVPSFGDLWCYYLSGSAAGGGLIPGLVITVQLRDIGKLQTVQEQIVAPILAELQRAGPRASFSLNDFTTNDYNGYRVQFTQIPLPIAPTWVLSEHGLVFGLTPELVTEHFEALEAKTSFADQDAIQSVLKRDPAPLMVSYSDPRPQVQGMYTLFNMFSPVIAGQMMQRGVDFKFPPLPPFSDISPHLSPSVTTLTPLPKGWLLEGHGIVPSIGTALPVVAVAGVLTMPRVDVAREAARRTQTKNNLKQIALAMHNYHDVHGHFPARFTLDKAGNPGLSWRVQLLPFLEEQALYDEFHFDEPWDSEHNKTLIDRMPAAFESPNDEELTALGMTRYVVPYGEGFLFNGDEGSSMRQVTDGTSNTIMAVEARTDHAVTWTEPDDLEIDLEAPLDGLEGGRPSGIEALLSDGSVRTLSTQIDIATLIALFTRAGGEVIGDF